VETPFFGATVEHHSAVALFVLDGQRLLYPVVGQWLFSVARYIKRVPFFTRIVTGDQNTWLVSASNLRQNYHGQNN